MNILNDWPFITWTTFGIVYKVGSAVLGAFKKSKRPYWGVMGRQFNIYRVLLDFSDSPTDACIYHIVLTTTSYLYLWEVSSSTSSLCSRFWIQNVQKALWSIIGVLSTMECTCTRSGNYFFCFFLMRHSSYNVQSTVDITPLLWWLL